MGMTRRQALSVAGLAPWLVVGAPLCVSCARTPRPVPPALLHTVWDTKPNGPLPPHGDDGSPIRAVALDGPPPSISGGALVGNLPPVRAAAYIQQDLTRKVMRIGASFGFGPGSPQSAVGLIAWVPGGALTGHAHISITPNRWTAATVQNGTVTDYASGHLRAPLVQDGRAYRAEARFDDDAVTIDLPDGTAGEGSSAAVAELTGTVACWEFYRESPSGGAVRLYQTWAG